MGRIGKYAGWRRKLEQVPQSAERIVVPFAELEGLCGEPLPKSARRHRPWWANQNGGGHSQAEAWMSAGWRIADVDFANERVTFIRAGRDLEARVTRPATDTIMLSDLIEAGFRRTARWTLKDERLRLEGSVPSGFGVYLFVRDETVLYVGKAGGNLRRRLYGYERPSLSQATNLRLSRLIIDLLKSGQQIDVYTLPCETERWRGLPLDIAAGIEAGIVKAGGLPWNMARG